MNLSWSKSVQWRVALGMPPRRRFTAEELARAGADEINPTVVACGLINVALPMLAGAALVGDAQTWPLVLVLCCFVVGLMGAAFHAWRDPGNRITHTLYWALPFACGLATGLLHRAEHYSRSALAIVWAELLVGTLVLWLCIVWRHHHIGSRLRELDERERAIEMARRLAAAQLEPHFLFNTLASLQHWVDVGDARAGRFLHSLTAYLRATLPMFDRPLQPLGAELDVVRRYLEVMQLRLGPRLQWQADIPEALHGVQLPPGTLLTLVENAIEHGIEPQLRGGRLQLSARVDDGAVLLSVIDNGPGPAAGATDGLGLGNVRQRLRLTLGPSAQLSLSPAAGGGCAATIQWTTERSA